MILILGIVGSVIAFSTAWRTDPKFEQEFELNEIITISLVKGEDRALYATYEDEDDNIDCRTTGLSIEEPASDFLFDYDGKSWQTAFILAPDRDGDYKVECRSDSSVDLAIGETPAVTQRNIGLVGTLASPCLALTTAVIIVLVVTLRRKSHKDRLLRGQTGM
jgi:hypothetical protein